MTTLSRLLTAKRLQALIEVVVFSVALMAAIAMTAQADNRQDHRNRAEIYRGRGYHRGHHDEDWSRHEYDAHRYWNRPHFQPEPDVVYAPPVYSPPPVYEEPGLNLVFPLHIH